MVDSRTIGKSVTKIVVVFSLIFLIYGVLRVNITLPEVVRQNSSFHVTYTKEPLDLTMKVAGFNISFKGESFINFIKGISVIGDAIEELIGN
ncbi:hypothetical protein, partial [Clostridium sp.]